MSVTCGYNAEAQDAVERGAERFPVFCHDCGQRIPFHFSRDRRAELQAQVKMLTCGSAMIDLYRKVKDKEAKAYMASLTKTEREYQISALKKLRAERKELISLRKAARRQAFDDRYHNREASQT